jgi:hypothetical protein
MTDTPEKIKFQPGAIVATLGALQIATNDQIHELLTRHLSGDWGDLDKEDAKANEHALRHDLRILSSYKLPDDRKLWIITEADRSATTVLTPDEY